MFLSVLAEFLFYLFDFLGDLLLLALFEAGERRTRNRWLLTALAGFEMALIVMFGYFLQPHLSKWWFALALFVLVFLASVGFFAVANLMVKDKRRQDAGGTR